MHRPILITILSLLSVCLSWSQQTPPVTCGQQAITDKLLRENSVLRKYHEQAEQQLQQYQLARLSGAATQRTNAVVSLPVVVHIIHNNGAENISNAQVLAGIQHLNEAFANTGYYDPADGVNTQIQFCLAQRDPNNNPTNGITRDVSPYTVMGGPDYHSDDQNVKNLNRWNPSCYINIWLVRSIPGSVAGYAYLPTAHGSNLDGIVMEATWFGSSPENSVVTIHEMGHYLGLYHTFQGACKNDDCTADGDRVCDTPPDQSTGAVGCNTSVNSCSTDALSGFGTDVNDLKEDYMDYGNFDCMKVFTQGQADRMNWFIQNVRGSLLQCKSCLTFCPAPVTASFTASGTAVTAGTAVTFTNSSVNGGTYAWYLNNVLQSTTSNYSYTFNTPGTYTIKLVAYSSNPLCDSAVKTEVITVTCPVAVHFTPPDTAVTLNTTLNFTNATSGATSYSWLLNGVAQSTAFNFSQAFTSPGNYTIKLIASNGLCSDSLTRTVVVTGACVPQLTFQNTYGGSRDFYGNDIRATPDGGYIIAGRTFVVSSGADDGYLLKINNAGVVQWSHTYGGARADAFYRIIVTADGGFIAVGQTRSYGFLTGAALAVKTDATGIVQWARQFGENSTFGEIASNVLQTSDGGYVITGRQNNNPGTGNVLVIKLDAAGNLVWTKVYDDSDSDNGSALLEDNGGILVAGTSRSATWHDALIMKLDPANGNVIWSKKYDIDGRNNSGGVSFYRQGNRYLYQVTTIDDFTNTNTGRAMILDVDLNGDAVDVREIIAPDYQLGGPGLFVLTPDGGFAIQHTEDNGAADFNLFKFNAAGNMEWTRKHARAGVQTNLSLRIAPDGGFISVGNHLPTGGVNRIYVVKSDIQGNTDGCPSSSVQVRINHPPFTTSPFSWFDIRNGSISINAINLQEGAGLVGTNSFCSGSICTTPPPDTCSPTFQKTYVGTGNHNVFYIHATPDGGSVLAGNVNPVAGDANQESPSMDALVMKLSAGGTLQWAKRIGGASYDEFRRIKPTRDGGYIAIGASNSFYTRGFYLVKLNANGTVNWSKHFYIKNNSRHIGLDVIETADGSFVFTGSVTPLPTPAEGIIVKTDAGGNIIWSQQLVHEAGTDIHSVLEDNDTLVLGANYWALLEQRYYGSIIKMNKNTGAIISSIRFSLDNRSNFNIQLFKTSYGFMAGLHLIDGNNYNSKQQGVAKFTQNLDLLSYQKLQMHDTNPWSSIFPSNDGGFIASAGRYAFGNNFYLFKAGAAGTLDWQKAYGNFPGIIMQTAANVQQYADGSIISACTYQEPVTGTDGKIHVVKAAANGTTPGCRVDEASNTLSNVNVQTSAMTWSNITTPVFETPLAVTSTVLDVALTEKQQCAPVTCSLTGITGDDTVCLRGDTITYSINRNSGCSLPAVWDIDPTLAKITSFTDSTVRLVFLRRGTAMLYATITAPCTILKDSLLLTAVEARNTLDLGPDVQLCAISTWSLNAGTGFAGYQWQDGSSDSTFTAYGPGMYHVLATDHCGNEYRDTVYITQAPPVPFDLGADLELCRNDTLTLAAPAGFSNYRWSAHYRISPVYGQTIRIFTDRDTIYSVTAERGPGCLVMDTIRVKVKPVMPVSLGNDTSFCNEKSLVLDAGPGFSAYSWNTGASTQQISAGTAGTFRIAATNPNGCISRDTLTIHNVYALPKINLGKDTFLCRDKSMILNPGSGFSTYLWHDGSTANTYMATQPGTYAVLVTDRNNCEAADTILFTSVKDCLNGLYMPSAFSPNNDRNNDLFKPKVYGLLDKFRLTIYNRWGERIFETTDAWKGWDGTYKGKPQDTGIFVWTCQYRFTGTGQEEKVEKGVVTLVK